MAKYMKIQPNAYTYATVIDDEKEEYSVVLVAASMQQLAHAMRVLAKMKLNPALVDKVEVLPQ